MMKEQTLSARNASLIQVAGSPSWKRGQGGFTLIEVLVSVLVLLVGLLGVVGMQMLSLQENRGAYFRSQATHIGAEILDAIRANPNAAPFYPGVYPENGAGNNTVPPDQTCDDATGCTPSETALQDLREWSVHFVDVYNVGATRFRPSIPNGSATITRAGDIYTVQVNWTQRQFDDNDDTDGSGTRSQVQQNVTLSTVITP